MPKVSLHAQASAVDIAAMQAERRGYPGLDPKDWDHIAPGLAVAYGTLCLLQAWRDRLPPAFIAEIEGEL